MPGKKIGRPKKPENHFRDLLGNTIPFKDILTKEEYNVFNELVELYISDFNETELSSYDMDDIMTIAVNKVLEFRMLKNSKGSIDKTLDVSQAIDRLRRQNEKLKENLVTRRRDRIDPKKFSGFSIVDLAAGWDHNKKIEKEKIAKEYMKKDKEVSKSDALIGNKNDQS